MSVTVSVDSTKLIDWNSHFQTKQYPFAISLAINKVSEQAVDNVRKRMSAIYNIRRKWTLKRVNYIKSNKRQASGILDYWKIHSEIYLEWSGLALMEEGGTKTPKTKKKLAVPQRDNLGVPVTRNIPQSKTVSKLKGFFSSKFKAGKTGFFMRSKDKKSLKFVYAMTTKADYKSSLQFSKTVRTTVNRHLQSWLEQSINQAIQTAK
jgi:hypothetical protein